jgi:hypothetical protein
MGRSLAAATARAKWNVARMHAVKVAYVVISHREPAQVLRLVRALTEGPGARVLVRHDPRHAPLDPAALAAAGAEALHDDIQVEWAARSYLELMLRCLGAARERHDPDWALVLSGQDYPLRPLASIEADLAASPADCRLGSLRAVETHRPRTDVEFFLRCRYRHYARPRALPPLPGRLRPLIYTRELPPLVGIRRLARPPLPLYVSSDWLALRRPALAAVLAAADDRRLSRYFRRVAVPSEAFFASVLEHDPTLTVDRDNGRYARFASPTAAHPDTLTSADLDALLASAADFARKFDIARDATVLDHLDRHRRAAAER